MGLFKVMFVQQLFRPLYFQKSIRLLSSTQQINSSRLAEVGKLKKPIIRGKYDTGQLFLHRIFGYRGVVLFPWSARVYDRDLPNKVVAEAEKNEDEDANPDCKTSTFYQVLIDSRDCPYIRAQTEAVTFLGNQESSRSLYAIPGLDYVSHEDILPYSSGEKIPLHHELFDKFLCHSADKDPPYEAQETLRAWQKKNHPWLELSDVHRETSEGIRIHTQTALFYCFYKKYYMEQVAASKLRNRTKAADVSDIDPTAVLCIPKGIQSDTRTNSIKKGLLYLQLETTEYPFSSDSFGKDRSHLQSSTTITYFPFGDLHESFNLYIVLFLEQHLPASFRKQLIEKMRPKEIGPLNFIGDINGSCERFPNDPETTAVCFHGLLKTNAVTEQEIATLAQSVYENGENVNDDGVIQMYYVTKDKPRYNRLDAVSIINILRFDRKVQ